MFGVVGYDVASGGMVPVKREGILPVRAGGAIAAFAEVEATAAGEVITRASGIPIGRVLTAATTGTDAEVELYKSGSIA